VLGDVLFKYLLDTNICNASKIWISEGHGDTKRSGHLAFRMKLANQLMKHTTSANYTLPIDGMGVRTNLASYCKSTSQNDCEGNHIVLSENHKECKACCARSRYTSAGTKRSLYQTDRRTLLTLERTERRQEEYAPHERDMAVQNAKSTSVNLVHVGKSILKQNLLKGTRGRERNTGRTRRNGPTGVHGGKGERNVRGAGATLAGCNAVLQRFRHRLGPLIALFGLAHSATPAALSACALTACVPTAYVPTACAPIAGVCGLLF
jgi:hypothetical protein